MSFSAHRKATLDVARPVAHRASHLRSCFMLVSAKHRVPRSELFAACKRDTGIDPEHPDDSEFVDALVWLERRRVAGRADGG